MRRSAAVAAVAAAAAALAWLGAAATATATATATRAAVLREGVARHHGPGAAAPPRHHQVGRWCSRCSYCSPRADRCSVSSRGCGCGCGCRWAPGHGRVLALRRDLGLGHDRGRRRDLGARHNHDCVSACARLHAVASAHADLSDLTIARAHVAARRHLASADHCCAAPPRRCRCCSVYRPGVCCCCCCCATRDRCCFDSDSSRPPNARSPAR